MNKRAVLIVLDSVGVGELPDAARYGDEGSNTLSHVAKETKGFSLPNMAALGLGLLSLVAAGMAAHRCRKRRRQE